MRKARALRGGHRVRQASSNLKKALRSTTVSGSAQLSFGAAQQPSASNSVSNPVTSNSVALSSPGAATYFPRKRNAETLDAFERRKHRLLGRIVGRGLVAKLQQGQPIQRRPVPAHLLGKQKGPARHRNNPATLYNETRCRYGKSCAHIHVRGKNARHEERAGKFCYAEWQNSGGV
jgi:hypothetical protein